MKKEEYLAMSLPYGLMCNVSTKSGYYYTLVEYKPLDYENEFTHKVLCSKPILHPLSDLTKPIEHNGETFIPIEKIAIYDPKNIQYFIEQIYTGFIEYIVLKQLIEWHFDLFDGIKNKDAISVNDLEINPYK